MGADVGITLLLPLWVTKIAEIATVLQSGLFWVAVITFVVLESFVST